MKFKALVIKNENPWFKRIFQSSHFRRTVLFITLGAIGGFLLFYLNEGVHMDKIGLGDIVRSTFVGGFFGYFITNSPCARGRC